MSFSSKIPAVDTLSLPNDPNAASRKKDHIDLAFKAQTGQDELDRRFYYEPLLSGHPDGQTLKNLLFLGKTMRVPIWVSSMTGGTELAHTINHNLARACREFGMGMGLGSCRQLLYSDERFQDFNVRAEMGDELPLYANLGIAQLEEMIERGELGLIRDLLDKLQADGLIIHVNPLQEWLQPEGDRFRHPPLDTIRRLLDKMECPLIVKEVGQGMGRASLEALLQLPLAAIDFAAHGGTNFAKLEMLRDTRPEIAVYENLARVGHSAEEMVGMVNELVAELGDRVLCRQVIVSGGVKDFLDGYYHIRKLKLNAIYGQASGFLKHARGDYEVLQKYVQTQVEGLKLAYAFLRVK
ncbi:MAG TPA: isopentenyl-diphosphate delta-isomerase [Saprospiraceae bacterium]|nr:isopentenyl-diphosphate delta-isomerase [Saprospiraceae bacterium]HMQ85185.1 isopentenyl-diphosphate delta-isomerase [Saprospiraceae bacterium]